MQDRNIVYLLAGPDGSVRFVGYTGNGIKERMTRFRSAVKVGKAQPVIQWIREVGLENITPRTIEVLDTPEHLKERSEYWAEWYRKSGSQLLNVTHEQISERARARLASPEARAAHSAALKGIKRSDEARARMSASKRGQTISDAQKAAISRVHTGKIVSQETRDKISQKAMGHKRNLGRVQTEETKIRMSHTNHLNSHVARDVIKDGCRWCAGATLESVIRDAS